jgi:hypothetical protein
MNIYHSQQITSVFGKSTNYIPTITQECASKMKMCERIHFKYLRYCRVGVSVISQVLNVASGNRLLHSSIANGFTRILGQSSSVYPTLQGVAARQVRMNRIIQLAELNI